MPTTRTQHGEATLSAAELFVEWLGADDEMVRAEFDAIIAAEWPSPPPDTPQGGDGVDRSPGTARHQSSGGRRRLPDRVRHPGVDQWTRPRSPPGSTNRDRKEGDRPSESTCTR